MVGKIPGTCILAGRIPGSRAGFETWRLMNTILVGLISLEANGPLPISVPRAKGFNMGIVAVLEKKEDVAAYAVHPAHLEYVISLMHH